MVYRISVYLYIFITFKYQHGLYLEKASTATHIFYNYVLSRSNQVKIVIYFRPFWELKFPGVVEFWVVLKPHPVKMKNVCMHRWFAVGYILIRLPQLVCTCVCVCAMHSHLHQTFHFESVICRLVGVPTISHAKQCPLQRPTAVMRLDNQLVMAISLQGKHTGYIVGCLRKV